MPNYAITDIHGCLFSLRELLEKVIPLHQENIYYFLGDYINKGPDSKGALDYLIHFASFYKCRFLRGNHEQMLLNHLHGQTISSLQMNLLNASLKSFDIEKLSDLPYHYYDFINNMEWYINLPNCLLVHAGFNFDLIDLFADRVAMINIKNVKYDEQKASHKKVFCGHIPQTIAQLQTGISSNAPVIRLDTGCVYRKNAELGQLTAINLDTLELYHQSNIEPDYPIEIWRRYR